jgi:hypothetical protein
MTRSPILTPATIQSNFTNIAGINAHSGIATFEGKLTGSGKLTLNAHGVGYIEVNGNTEVLVNTTNTAEDCHQLKRFGSEHGDCPCGHSPWAQKRRLLSHLICGATLPELLRREPPISGA